MCSSINRWTPESYSGHTILRTNDATWNTEPLFYFRSTYQSQLLKKQLCETFFTLILLAKSPHSCLQRSSTSSSLLQTVWWRWLREAAAPARPGSSTPIGPFPCWTRTLRLWAGSGPRLDPGHGPRARRWAEWGSGRNPRSAGRPGSGEMKEREEWSWRGRRKRSWRGGRWSCRTEELLLWLWSDWGRWRELRLYVSASPCPEGGMVETRVRQLNITWSFVSVTTALHDSGNISDNLQGHLALLLTVWVSDGSVVSPSDESTFRDTFWETEKFYLVTWTLEQIRGGVMLPGCYIRELFWIHTLGTLQPLGLNQDFDMSVLLGMGMLYILYCYVLWFLVSLKCLMFSRLYLQTLSLICSSLH